MYINDEGTSRLVTATDVARRLGVSQTTVSRILSGTPGHRYAIETCRRVREEAERLGYKPNAVGRSLREGRTRVIGFYSFWNLDARNVFLAEIIGSLQRACFDTGYSLLLQTFPSETPVDQVLGELTCGRMDGVVLHTPPGNPIVEGLRRTNFPAVAVTDALPGLPSIVCDDHQGVHLALDYLEEKGHRQIAFLHPRVFIASAEARVNTFSRAMRERGLEPMLFPIEFEDVTPVLDKLLKHHTIPTAAFCWNDVTALHLLHTCRHREIRVPEDLAVVGFDGILDTQITAKELTTINAGWSEVTKAAMTVLLQRIAGDTVPEITVIPVSIRIGETA